MSPFTRTGLDALAAASDVATRCPWCEGHPSPCADHRAEPEVTRYWLGTCPKDGVHIGIKTTADPNAPAADRTEGNLDSTCLCGTTLTLRLVSRAEYEDVLGPDDEDDPDDEPDDGGPFRPRWPLLVSDDTKRTLLAQLAEVVHAPEPTGSDPRAAADWGTFRRGVEYGMAKVMLTLGINEAGSPERASLPAPEQAAPQPADELAPEPTAPLVHAYAVTGWGLVCGASVGSATIATADADLVTCGACLDRLLGDIR